MTDILSLKHRPDVLVRIKVFFAVYRLASLMIISIESQTEAGNALFYKKIPIQPENSLGTLFYKYIMIQIIHFPSVKKLS